MAEAVLEVFAALVRREVQLHVEEEEERAEDRKAEADAEASAEPSASATSRSSMADASRATMVGSDSTAVIPSAVDADAAVPRREVSLACNASAVVKAGTLIVAVMITLAASTLMDTDERSTPALTAIEVWRAEVSE